MSYTVSMDRAGRIVIPKAVRERIGAKTTARFSLDVVLDRIELTPKEEEGKRPRVIEKNGVWVVMGTGKPATSIEEAIRQDREDRVEHLLGDEASNGIP